MNLLDDYYSSYVGEEYSIDHWFLIKRVRFTNWTPHSKLPQNSAMVITLRKNEFHEEIIDIWKKAVACDKNIVKIYHQMELRDKTYAFFMELCDKDSLADIIYSNIDNFTYWTEPEVLKIFATITKTIKNLHNAGIAHRDIKPHSIFVSQNNEIRIGNLWASKKIRLNVKNTALGTPGYMSPFLERMLENKRYKSIHIDPYKEDVWSAGKTLYEIATMKLCTDIPNNDKDIREIVIRAMSNSGHHDFLTEIILSMLNCDKNLRPSMAEVHGMIKRYALANFEISKYELYSVRLKESLNTPIAVNYKNELFIAQAEDQSAPENIEQLRVQVDHTVAIGACELCNNGEIFTHICGSIMDANQFVSFINEMIATNENYNNITCMECGELFPLEIFQCRSNHFEKQPNNFFT